MSSDDAPPLLFPELARPAAAPGPALPRGFTRFGTATWNYPGWRGLVYPAASPESMSSAERLALYAASGRFDTVEADFTFYRPQTAREWRKVVVTVNDHFRAGAERLAPGGRLTAPLTQLRTAFGQQFDIRRQSVFKVEVAATDDEGKPVALQWGAPSRPASPGGKP